MEGLEMRRHPLVSQRSTVEIRKRHAVSVRRAQKNYGPLNVLNGLNMTVPKGAIYGLLGSSGCGKTTLLNCVIGRKRLDAGEMWVLGGRPGTSGSCLPGPQIGYMPQEIALYSEFSIRETMKYFGWIAHMSTERVERRLKFLVDLLKLPDADRKIRTLSGGQQRRASFATVLLHEPELLILDEPTVGLDPLLREAIWKHLGEITSDGRTTVILTTHYIEETRHAHLIGLMRGGYILAEESPSSILSRFNTDTLEDAFLKLSVMQNMGRRRRSIAAQSVASSVTLPSDLVNVTLKDDVDGSEISAEFGDSIVGGSTGRRFSLVPVQHLPDLPPPKRRPRVTDYLLKIDAKRMKALIWKNFMWMLTNWQIMVTLATLPLVQFAMFYTTIGRAPKHVSIGVVNYESNRTACENLHCETVELSCNYLGYLTEKDVEMMRYATEVDALNALRRGDVYSVVVFRRNYTDSLKARLEHWRHASVRILLESTIDVYQDGSVKDIALFLRLYLYDSFVTFIGDYLEECGVNRKVLKVPFQWQPPVYGSKSSDFTEFASPGALITISFFLSAGLTAVAMLIERNEGILERSLVMGVTVVELLASHVLSEFVVMIAQITSLVCFSVYVFRLPLNGSLMLFLGLILLAGFCGMWYGFALSSACDRETTAAYVLLGSFFPVILLCGIVWPIEGMVDVLQVLSYALPLTRPVESLRSIMQRGWGLAQPVVYQGFVTIGVWTLIFGVISVVLLKFKKG